MPISIQVNHSREVLQTETSAPTAPIAPTAPMSQKEPPPTGSTTTNTFDTSDSVAAELIESKQIINQLRIDLELMKSEIAEMKSKQLKFEIELKRVNDTNNRHVKTQQKKILFLMKRLLDLEHDDEETNSEETSASQLKETMFRF